MSLRSSSALFSGLRLLGRRFGSAKRWSVLVGGSYDDIGRRIDDIEPVPTPDSLTPR